MHCIEIETPGGPEALVQGERDAPQCGSGDVLIRVAAVGVNRADILQRQGKYPPPPGASDILGLEVAGEIVEVGSDVSQWSTGDRVCALLSGGAYAEYAVTPAEQCLPVPDSMSMVEAASLPEALFTVFLMVYDQCQLKPGERLLVHGGSSGIGVTAIQMAKALGSSVVVTAGTDEKCRRCEALGADHAVNYKNEDFVERYEELLGKNCMDVVLDMVGGDYVGKNMRLASTEGRIINIAYQRGYKTGINFLPMMLKRLSLKAHTLRSQPDDIKAAIAGQLVDKVWPLVVAGKIMPVVDRVFPLAEASDAHRYMEQGEHIGKIVLEV